MAPIILIADPYCISAKGLIHLLQSNFGCRGIDFVGQSKALLKMLEKREYTHLFIDVALEGACIREKLSLIRNLYPEIEIMVASMDQTGVLERGLANLGIQHFYPKWVSIEELIRRLKDFFYGKQRIMPDKKPNDSPFDSLTNRQKDVLQLILEGRSGNEIAEALNLKANTVSTLKKQLLERTQTKNANELTQLASFLKVPETLLAKTPTTSILK